VSADVCEVVRRVLRGEISAEVALMELLLRGLNPALLGRTLEELSHRSAVEEAPPAGEPLVRLLLLLKEHESGCERIAAMLAGGAGEIPPACTESEAIDLTRQFFDRAVGLSEEASVAAYSLASPCLLDKATSEIVRLMRSWGLLGRNRAALEIGCGIGRMQIALAGEVKEACGIDISAHMIDVARRRSARMDGLRFFICSGKDLSMFPASRFNLVFAVDSFPYIHASGPALVEAHFREVARVLGPAGDLAIFNFSYRSDPDQDRCDVRALAAAYRFDVLTAGTTPFSLWNGLAFHLRRAY
jgi:SAM-dependent methyltransferase